MNTIAYRGMSFSLPDGFEDQTILTYAGGGAGLTVSRDALEGGKPALLRYVSEQIEHIQKQAPGYTVVEQSERNIGERPGLLVHAKVQKVVQHQLFVLADKTVHIVAVTAQSDADAHKALDAIASSLRID